MDVEGPDAEVEEGPAQRGIAGPGPAGDEAEPAPSSALMALPHDGTVTLGPGEIQQLAGELATQLFQRWEVALQEQFREELGLRLEAELEHRAHEARVLRAEVHERRQRLDNPWRTRHGAWGHATWEVEQTIKRQAADLEQTEREIRELRERLRALGHEPDGGTRTVDANSDRPEPEGMDEPGPMARG